MKVIIEGEASFHRDTNVADDKNPVAITLLGPPDEELEPGQILICHPKCSITLSRRELQRALRAFEPGSGSSRE